MAMNKKTLEAVRESIGKWESIVNEVGHDDGNENCALCTRFSYSCYTRENRKGEKCPVAIKVRDIGCKKTPYFIWTDHHNKQHYGDDFPLSVHAGCEPCVELATDELNFLQSLLPRRKKIVVNVKPFKGEFDLIIRFEGERK